MFIDQARIFVKAGSGGDGCNSILRERGKPYGKPNGGNGGSGGNIILKTSTSIQTLLDFHYNRHFKAEPGHNGGSNFKAGRNGKDSTVLIPCGTIVKDNVHGFVLRDMINPGEEVIIARGGKGGRGNSRFREASAGEPGEEKDLLFELKLIADVGIIGYPNAGKSTFISKVSSARSKAANYPFTTKAPILGIVRHHDSTLTFADMPGLIEGAHRGKGLGDKFLKHIERTRILLHMVDVSMIERQDPYQDILNINRELELFNKDLLRKKKIIVLSKIDALQDEKVIKKIKTRLKEKVFAVSSLTGAGIKELLDYIFETASL